MTKMNNGNEQSPGDDRFFDRVLLYTGIGLLFKLKGENLAKLAILGPITERALGITPEQVMQEWVRQNQEKERQEMVKQILENWGSSIRQIHVQLNQKTEASLALPAPRDMLTDKDSRWLSVITHPSVVLVLGKRGSGKSGLGYRLLELFRYQLRPYVLGVPAEAQKLLPAWVGMAPNLDKIPQDSIVLVDEAYLSYHSRESLKAQSRDMSRMVNLSRQRNQTLVFITQEARQIDKNIVSQANVLIFKELGMLQLKFERPELNDIAIEAKEAFSKASGDKRMWAYVYSPDADFIGIVENLLPSFWSTGLSHAFAAGEPESDERMAKKTTRHDKMAKAKELHRGGLSYRKIANMLGVNEATAYNYVNDYPYKE